MKVWHRTLLAVVFCTITSISIFAQDNATDLPPDGNIVVVNSAFVRSGPSNDYLPVGALFNGDEVTPVNISTDGQWILILYSRGTGWIQRILVRWDDDAELNQLPIIQANITPTPRIEITNTPFIPTITPEGNYINVEGASSAYVRAGPGRGYLRLGQLLPGDLVEAVARNEDTSWVMVRYSNDVLEDGFGWLAYELVYWEELDELEELPIINVENLTPTPTFTPSVTPSITATVTQTATPTFTNTPTDAPTVTETPEPTATNTVSPVPTDAPTVTQTPEPSATNTVSPVPTDAPTVTQTPEPSATSTVSPEPTETSTDVPTETVVPSATYTDIPLTETNTPLPTETPTLVATNTDVPPTETNTPLPTETPTPLATNTDVSPTATDTEVVSAIVANTVTDQPTMTLTNTATPQVTQTDIFAINATSVASESTSLPITTIIDPPEPTILEETTDAFSLPLSIEAIVGLVILLIVLAYIWFYWQGLSAVGLYSNGFIIQDCPVCQRGKLHVDDRPSRMFGIPTVRRTVRCDECRSVLRETGAHRWRYAVDRIENPTMYDRFNGKQITDSDLERLGKMPPLGASARTSPEFVDDEG